MRSVSEKIDETIHELAAETIEPGEPPEAESSPALRALKALGTEPWVDTGELEKARAVWKREFGALTTNNTLANQVVQSGVMDGVIRETVARLGDAGAGLSEEEKITEIGFVINCKIALRLVQAFKVQVSVELHPCVARDIGRTLHFARRYFRVCPDYFIIKVPLTPEGFLAVRTLRREGMPINFTLGFSARQNYLAARLANPSYVNVFLGRLNQVVVENGLGSGSGVGEKVTLATQGAIAELRRQHPDVSTRLIGASIRGGEQVGFLAGVDVLTIPPAAIEAFSPTRPETVKTHFEETVRPGIDAGDHAASFEKLWEVPAEFKVFSEVLAQRRDLETMDGDALRRICADEGVDLFHDFTAADYEKITGKGKIPRLGDWPGTVALDDLMTQSALMSFAKDQAELDARIRSFLD